MRSFVLLLIGFAITVAALNFGLLIIQAIPYWLSAILFTVTALIGFIGFMKWLMWLGEAFRGER